MEEFLSNAYVIIMNIISSSSIFGPILACILIFIESILPILPLFVFITINFIAFGYILGFIISYILTILGCIFSFYLCRGLLKDYFKDKFRKNKKFDKLMKKIDKMKFSNLVLLIAIPFTPAFLINIATSLSEMELKKFTIAIIIGKLSIVFFWGFIGTSLVESLKNPKILIIIFIMLVITYILSRIAMKKLKIN